MSARAEDAADRAGQQANDQADQRAPGRGLDRAGGLLDLSRRRAMRGAPDRAEVDAQVTGNAARVGHNGAQAIAGQIQDEWYVAVMCLT